MITPCQALTTGSRQIKWLLILTGIICAAQPTALSLAAAEAWSEAAVVEGAKRSPRGAKVYAEHCAVCHEHGVNRAPVVYHLRMMMTETIYRALSAGAMRLQAQSLSDQDKHAVAYFLSGIQSAKDVKLAPPACQGKAAHFDFDNPPAYPGWGMTLANTRFAPKSVTGLDSHNVSRLRLKWALGFDGASRVRSEPALAAGAIYIGSQDGRVYALDRKTGCERWQFAARSEVRTGVVVSPWRVGDSTAQPIAYFADFLGNVYAVDAIKGTLVWSDHADPHPATTLTGTPVLYEGRLYVPATTQEKAAVGGNFDCCTSRGSLIAYDARTGKRLWQSFLVDKPLFRGLSKSGSKLYGPSGAGIWSSPAIDERRGLLFFATSNNYSSPATKTSDAVIAMDLKSGKIKWSYQATVNDAWNLGCMLPNGSICPKEHGVDYDFGAAVILTRARDGREFVLAGQKSGWVYCLNPNDGKLLWKTKVGRGGAIAGVHFGMAAGGDALYVPISDAPDGRQYSEPAKPGLYALDIRTGEFIWKAPNDASVCQGRPAGCDPGIASPVTVSEDLVLSGGNDGILRIHSAQSGKVLWQFDTAQSLVTVGGGVATGGSIGGGAGPLVYDGTLVVESGYAFAWRMPGNLMLVFEVQ